MTSELWAAIRRMFEIDKLSKSAIARRLSVHRWTVRRALSSQDGPPADAKRRPLPPPKLDPFKAYLAERLKDYPELSGHKLLQEIRGRGYPGGHSILREYLQTLRPARNPKAFLRLETQPAEFAQVDWAHCGTIIVGNAKRKLSCFVMVLSWSRMIYIEFTLSQTIEEFMTCHINAFDYFGGVPHKINYDNLKSVVLSRWGKNIRFQPRFIDFAGFYLFDPIPCNVRAAWEKGKVESAIRFVRSAFLEGREISSFAQLQKDAVDWMDNAANVRIHATTRERPVDRWEQERTQLYPVPSREFDTSLIRSVTATRQALVAFDANRYSVPHRLAGATLTLHAEKHVIHLFDDKGRQVAEHTRCYEKYRVIENSVHYEGLLSERKKARQTKRVEAFLALAPECAAYLKGLAATELHVPTHLDKMFDLMLRYGKPEVLSALIHALPYGAFGAHYIERIIHQRRAAQNTPEPQPISLIKKPELADITVEETDLALYDRLFEEPRP
jgi:transposase